MREKLSYRYLLIFNFLSSLPVKAELTCDPISSDVLNAIQEQINVFRRKHDIADIALKNEAKAPVSIQYVGSNILMV